MAGEIRPRVLMLTSTLPRWVGDAEPGFILDLARELSAEFDVELIAPHAPGAATMEVMQGVAVSRFRYWWPRWQAVAYQGGMTWRIRENPLRLVQLPFFFGSLAWATIKRLRREPAVSLIHAHWLIPQGLTALLACRLANRPVPVLCTSHGGDLLGLRGRALERLKRHILQASNGITVVSRPMVALAQELAPGIYPIVIPMGTDLRERFVPGPSVHADRARRLVFVGRLVPKKGLDHLLDALHMLRNHGTDFSMEIVGHGPLLPQLRERSRSLGLEDNVKFVGPVPHERLAQHYQRASIAVFPFIQEGFGLVMVEAMGCGCAVIASDLPAVRDVLQHGDTGMLVPAGDPAALGAMITHALANPQSTRDIADRGRKHALEHFDWDMTRKKFGAMYRAMLERNRPPP